MVGLLDLTGRRSWRPAFNAICIAFILVECSCYGTSMYVQQNFQGVISELISGCHTLSFNVGFYFLFWKKIDIF
jgi:hypothetical protein